ncbi:glycosyltransferase family 2 protein [Mycobacterium seoulense]|uniref:PGL/p-HBAD biosynthesis glycosyltransferase n=1 Tax=Mycobacterium seoulense TaxID=386911 RepID=A0A7I7NW42_9MYCO|nr:glycosyltransferase family 2 protein [Mycobacterium seoulense]MCV7440514.1 glycosyltransferase [Mycobacterium seoulense]BBY00460.1 PGL/p-HBAD biosynthesis glycosyltransferase [Mycobacterium seoulense]
MFSIIVPTLNVAATLPACLESVVQQTCSDFELVLVDGGSTDETLEIAKSFASDSSPQMLIHSAPDQGTYDAMNRGVSMANGTWLLFLGADDTVYEAETLKRVAAFIADHEPSDLVYGDVLLRSTSVRHAGAFDLDRLLYDTNICHQSIFYRRELFAGIGPYNLRYPVCADWDFNIRCFSNPALVARYMDIVVARYNDMSGVSMNKDKEFLKRLPVYLWIFNLMRWSTKEGRRALFLGYVRSFRIRASQVREAGSRLFGARAVGSGPRGADRTADC